VNKHEQIEKLAHLRDAGALTDEEFQAKKTEILGRI
jgi:Short C-terminal domain